MQHRIPARRQRGTRSRQPFSVSTELRPGFDSIGLAAIQGEPHFPLALQPRRDKDCLFDSPEQMIQTVPVCYPETHC
jgi:hypothetical protein